MIKIIKHVCITIDGQDVVSLQRICEWARLHYEKENAGGRHAFFCGDGQKEQAEAIDLMDKIFDA